ncbi:MAG: SecY-interacting protein [Oceanospirillales bacterium]|nr:SecY-interacting protein [Oceanospirillales bacterium]
MTSELAHLLDAFVNRYIEENQAQAGELPCHTFDPDWPSPCIITEAPQPGQRAHWRPVRQQPASDMFERLSEALEITLHPDIKTWYTRYWSDPIAARHPEGELTLLFCWNEEDMERLRGNLLGHIMAKDKQRQPVTLFFACTDGDEFMTLDNSNGSIWLERPGRKPIKQLASTLSEFLQQLTPLVDGEP